MQSDPLSLVSVVILNLNGRELLRKCIESVMENDYPNLEIIIVDNGSSDGSQSIVKEKFSQVRLIENETNLGYGEGNNIGIRNSRGELVLFLNNDIILNQDCIETIVNRVQSKKDFWIFGCKIYFGHLNKVIQYAGGKLDRSGSGVLTGYFERDYGQYDQESEVDWVHGAAFAVRKNLFDKIGHFDPIYYPIYHDEIDLCYRARKSGYKVLYVPAAVAYHFENTSSERISKTAFYRIRNTLIFAFKYYPVLSLFLLPFLHAKSIANGLRTPKYKQMPKVRILSLINSYITATIWILRSLPLIMQDRYLERQQRNR